MTNDQMGSKRANDLVRDVLNEEGDDGSIVRHVLHFAYPPKDTDETNCTVEPASREAIRRDLEKQGYEVTDALQGGLVFEHHHSVGGDKFDALTDSLRRYFDQHGWDYDGWECELVQGGLN